MQRVTHKGIELQAVLYIRRPYSLADCSITMETEKAIKVAPPNIQDDVGQGGIWMPKSQCAWTSGSPAVLFCEESVAHANGLEKLVDQYNLNRRLS